VHERERERERERNDQVIYKIKLIYCTVALSGKD
jgi:hypothetical protein